MRCAPDPHLTRAVITEPVALRGGASGEQHGLSLGFGHMSQRRRLTVVLTLNLAMIVGLVVIGSARTP